MTLTERLVIGVLTVLGSGSAFSQGSANSYPSKPVTLVVPLAAGGPVDREARLYAGQLAKQMGQPFVLDYRPGAAGTIAAAYVVKAAPDGHILYVANGAFSTFPALYKNLSFDPIKDLAAVALMTKRPQVMVVPPSFPANTVADYIAHAKKAPRKINFGTTGKGSGGHLGGAWLHSATSTQVTFVHYKGVGPLLPDLLAGRLDVTLAALSVVEPLVKSGKVKALAMMGDKRTPLFPALPTIAEQTVPGFDYSGWTGILAPASTPGALVGRINAALVKVIKLREVSKLIEKEGNEVVGSTPAQFKQLIISEAERWRKIVQEAGIKQE